MQQTLFHIPHALFEGWLLTIWLVVGLGMMGYQWLVAKRRSDFFLQNSSFYFK